MEINHLYPKRTYVIICLCLMFLFGPKSIVFATTPAQLERAKTCGFSEEEIEASIKAKPILETIDDNATSVSVGTGPTPIFYLFDYNCRACSRLDLILDILVKSSNDYSINYIIAPVTGKQSRRAARRGIVLAQEANAEVYLAYHNALMRRASKLDRKSIKAALQAAVDNPDEIGDKARSSKVDKAVKQNKEIFEDLGFRRGPALIFGDMIVNIDDEMFNKLDCLFEKE